jgi:hypothetical protein
MARFTALIFPISTYFEEFCVLESNVSFCTEQTFTANTIFLKSRFLTTGCKNRWGGGGGRWALASAQCDNSFKDPSIIRPISISLNHRVYRVPGFLSSHPNWVPPPPSAARECCSSPLWVQGGRHTRLRRSLCTKRWGLGHCGGHFHCGMGVGGFCTVSGKSLKIPGWNLAAWKWRI